MQRLENETGRLTKDIKQKEEENEVLREQIASLRCQIEQSNKMLEEVTRVSGEASDIPLEQCSPTNSSVAQRINKLAGSTLFF